jgi:hypothetical protein
LNYELVNLRCLKVKEIEESDFFISMHRTSGCIAFPPNIPFQTAMATGKRLSCLTLIQNS